MGSKRSERSGAVGDISIYISGPKTGWLNQGMARSHKIIPECEPNSHLRPPIMGLAKLWAISPAKFLREYSALATWMSGMPIRPDRVVALLRMAVSRHGMRPTANPYIPSGRGRDRPVQGNGEYRAPISSHLWGAANLRASSEGWRPRG